MKKMHWPKPLKEGSVVGIVAPASPPKRKALEIGVKKLEEWGLKPLVGKSCEKTRGYLAGEDKERAADINNMFASKEVDAIWCSNGGYGTPRILDFLDLEVIRENRKLFIGYSDITALHLVFNRHCSLVTIHGPMVATELGGKQDVFTEDHIKKLIFNDFKEEILINPDNQTFSCLVEGKGEGILTGGNLSLIASTIGTKYEIETKNRVLFLEEIDEEPYRIDRMLSQLKNSGKLSDLSGVILGDFTDCSPKKQPSLSLEEVFFDYFGSADYPVVTGLKCGHGKQSVSLPLGARMHIDTGKKLLQIFR